MLKKKNEMHLIYIYIYIGSETLAKKEGRKENYLTDFKLFQNICGITSGEGEKERFTPTELSSLPPRSTYYFTAQEFSVCCKRSCIYIQITTRARFIHKNFHEWCVRARC